MLTLTIAAIIAALIVFTFLGLQAIRQDSLDDYLTARHSQTGIGLALSFLASGMGAWILFAPPEIGALVGPIAVAGYAVGSALPFVILGLIGPQIRARLPAGRSLTEFAAERFGVGFRYWIAGLSVLYMLCFLAAELTAIGAITQLLSGVDGRFTIIAVALTTLAYTALGGLRASLLTDRWQSFLMLTLMGLVALAVVGFAPEKTAQSGAGSMPSSDLLSGLAVALTLVIAVTSANLFHQGYWQRVWAARDNKALRIGALIGGVSTVIVVAVLGTAGILAAMWGYPLGNPPIPFFALLERAPTWLTLPALILAITLVASSVDTLENALVSLGVTETGKIGLRGARWLTAILMLPVIALALQQVSVLRLFLIADLLCASAIIPLLSGLAARVGPGAAITGAAMGLIGAVLPGMMTTSSVAGGFLVASFPQSIPTLAPFVGALTASGVTVWVIAWVQPLKSPRPTQGLR
ncbi:MAG: sodium:solute symporter [Spiribacter sp.]|jgi:Na+/proline symporter|nr:sodium:solute symporter [Spiribacter sp.]MDR9489108.1 sodium:solute symporter [Spiribacter sp.]